MIDNEFEAMIAAMERKAARAERKLDRLDERIEEMRATVDNEDAGLVDRSTPSL